MGIGTSRENMKPEKYNKQLVDSIKNDIKKIEISQKNKKGLFAQTVFLGSLGLMFVIPVIFGAYLGVWLDNKLKGFSISWTISLIIVGIGVGVINVYYFLKE